MLRYVSVLLIGMMCIIQTEAEELRIDNNVQGVQSTAFLLENTFYSIIGNNGEIVEFNTDTRIFTLMDPALHIQTQINAEETREKAEELRKQVLNDPQTKTDTFRFFAVKPSFVSEFDSDSGLLALQSNWIDYEIKTMPLEVSALSMYCDFCDWMCYLNFRLNPLSSQMLIRLEVNRILKEKQRFAAQVFGFLYPGGKQGLAKSTPVSSSHDLIRRLSDADKKQIEQAQEFKRSFPKVPFGEYQKRFAEKWAK